MDSRALLCIFFLCSCHAPVVRASSYHCVGGRGKQGTGLVEYKFWRRMPKCYSTPRRFDRPSPIDTIRQETMKMCAFLFSAPLLTLIFFCLICYALSASARGAVREARARHWPLPQQAYARMQQLARYVLVTWLLYRWGCGDPFATYTCILLLTGQHCENATCCRVLTVALLSGSTQDATSCVRMASVLLSCFAPLFPPAVGPSVAASLASIEEWLRKHPQLKPDRHAACPEEKKAANLITKIRERCSRSKGPAPSQQQLSEAEAKAFNNLLSSYQSAAPTQPAQSKTDASMSCSTPATDVGCAADDSFYEAQHKEWCGMHCLNNYAGRKIISREDCYNAVEGFLTEIQGSETYDAHLDRENGRLSHELIAYLARKKLRLTLDYGYGSNICSGSAIDRPLSDGLLNYNKQHWTVLKTSGDR